MADLTGNPNSYSNAIRRLEPTDPGAPETWNPQFQALISNDAFLRALAQALDERISTVVTTGDSNTDVHGVGAARVAKTTREDQWVDYADIRNKPELALPHSRSTILTGRLGQDATITGGSRLVVQQMRFNVPVGATLYMRRARYTLFNAPDIRLRVRASGEALGVLDWFGPDTANDLAPADYALLSNNQQFDRTMTLSLDNIGSNNQHVQAMSSWYVLLEWA